MRIFSGIQPTGRKHLGNYIGAIRQYVEGQDRGDAIYCIVDLRERLYDTAAILLASGLDPARCILFRQSDVKEHTELCWLLASATAYGDLTRMHQFKEKSAEQRDFVSSGLFFYPVLQAADVLAYRTDEVPVGEDQKQHIELMRDIAQRFNSRHGETFVLPRHRIPEVGARIMDIQSPDRKMSTTGGSEQGTVFVLDEPAEILRKFKGAVTDSGRDIERGPDKPGITNLIEILAVFQGTTPEAVEKQHAEAGGYASFKEEVGQTVADALASVRERYAELRPDTTALERSLDEGAAKARAISSVVVAEARERMGLGPHV
jgi:tryptophanyl-tRNA synthetase